MEDVDLLSLFQYLLTRNTRTCWPTAKELMEYKNGQVAINPRFNKHFTSFRIAVEKGEK